ncbi:MAG TPA: sigma 54-interacting transcriptional regulator [Kofleriaceae bacterium]
MVLFGRVHGGRAGFALGPEPVQLGRDVGDERHIQLDDPLVSRRHAEIHWSEIHGRYWVRDLGSRNGVYLHGVRIAREVIACDDLLRIGDTVFRFTALEPGAPEPGAPEPALEPPFIGRSRSLRRSLELAARIAPSDTPVLILGPTGTGKDLLAAAIHRASRRSGALVPVNCAALPSNLVESELFGHERGAFSGADSSRAGLFRAAQAGTLFLDEIGELAPEIQAKLLRVLEARSIRPIGAVTEALIDVRVVAATNRDLGHEVAHGRFRADLYARLTESVVQLDPLRDRPEDLAPLWDHFVAQLGPRVRLELSGAAFEAMALHSWPFNVRELRQLVRAALLTRPDGGQLGVDDLPPAMQRPRQARPGAKTDAKADAKADARADGPPTPPLLLAGGEVPSPRQLRQLVEEFHGNVKDIAAFLGKDRKQIYRWLRRDRIDPDAYRRGSG